MIQKSIQTIINEIYSKGPKRNYSTKNINVYHIDDIWSLGILDLKDLEVLKTIEKTDMFLLS